MSKKKSPLWDYFEEDKNDYSFAICKVADCGVRFPVGELEPLELEWEILV